MNPTLPLVVLLATGSGEPQPLASTLTDAEQGALSRLSERWAVRFELAKAEKIELGPNGSAGRALSYSAEIAEQIEARLDAARTASGSADVADATAALDAAERLLRDHPELPQAAWLRAEQLSLRADIAAGPAASAPLRASALVLEGTRSLSFHEREPAAQTQHGSLPVVQVSVTVLGPAWSDELEWDGAVVTSPFKTHAGEHVVRVLRDERPIWAAWVVVSERAPVAALELRVPKPQACSLQDIGGARAGERGPVATPAVLCPRWAVARRLRGALEVALCRHSRCDHWRGAESAPRPIPLSRQEPVIASHAFPTWAAVALAGAGAVLATSVVLWQTGAFERHERTRFVYDGFERR